MQELRALLTKTKAELKEERDKVIELEDYTRRENLKFHNIPESEEEGVKGVANGHCTNSISRCASNWQTKRKQTQADNCSFRLQRRQRPGFARKKAIKESTRFKDAYITANYANAIQDELRKLIKAMFKAKEQGSDLSICSITDII